jgi:hypothetical protein
MVEISNRELLDRLKRNTLIEDWKLQNLEIVPVLPVTSANEPLHVREAYEDFDASPNNYLTIATASASDVGAATTSTRLTITVASGTYVYIWGMGVHWYSGGKDNDALWLSSTNTGSLGETNVLWAICSEGDAQGLSIFRGLSKPISLPTGTYYLRFRNGSGSVTKAGVCAYVHAEIRAIVNRQAGTERPITARMG